MAKKALKLFVECHGVHIQHYHCDNDCFAENAFIVDCKQHKQHKSIVDLLIGLLSKQLETFKNIENSCSMHELDGQKS